MIHEATRRQQMIAGAEQLRQELREFCRQDLPAALKRKVFDNLDLDKADHMSYLRALNQRGWAVGHWPKAYGGCDWTPLQRFVFEEESAIGGAPWLIPMGINYVGPVIYTFGNEEQKKRFLPKIVSGEEWWAQGYSEPGAGSDLASLKTRAVRQGDHYVVTGQKTWTSFAHWADWVFCLVRTDGGNRPQEGISFLLIDLKSPGITIRPIPTMDGCHHVNEVFFDDVRVPAANLVGEEGKGWSYGKFLLGNERILLADTGPARRQLDRLRVILDSGAVWRPGLAETARQRLADLELKLHTVRSICIEAALQEESGSAMGVEGSIIKIRGSELQQAISELTMECLGGYAAVFDPADIHGEQGCSPVGPHDSAGLVREYLYGRVKTIFGGSNEIQRNIISKAALGL